MSLRVEVDELHAAGAQITDAVSVPGALGGVGVAPAAADEVSVGVAQGLTALFSVLAAHSAAGAQVASAAAAVLQDNAAAYQHQEDLNTAALRPGGGTAMTAPEGLGAAPMTPTAPPPAVPSLPAGIAPTDGKTIATLIHGGPGQQPLLDAAALARNHANQLRDTGADIRSATTRLSQVWQSPAADRALSRLSALSGWYEDHADYTEAAARACQAQADTFAQARTAIPRPQEFENLEQRLVAANRANVATHGLYTPVVTELQTQLQATQAKALAGYAHYTTRAADLGTTASTLPPATVQAAGYGFKQDVPGDEQPKPDPVITGPAAPPQHEQDGYDLQDQFPDGQGPTFGGDPRDGVPRSPASQLAQGPPGTRPLPTGTAIGPDGHRYAFFSNAPNTPPTDDSSNPYTTNGSVWDYTNPTRPVKVGDLPGIYQASGVYDPVTKQMVIVGNTSNKIGDTTRGMWTSGPIDPAHPNNWINSLQHVGDVNLPGDRESQLVALKGGGYMLVGSTNGGPLQAITASTPQGLSGAIPQTLISQDQLHTVYGPTVTGTTVDPNGLETIQLRVSTWPPSGPPYDPHTYTTTFGVQH